MADTLGDRHGRVQRGVRVLEHHRQVPPERPELPLGEPGQVLALPHDAARRRVGQAQQRPTQRRLARAGLADQAEHLAPADVERDVVDRSHHARRPAQQPATGREVHGQPVHVEEDLARPRVGDVARTGRDRHVDAVAHDPTSTGVSDPPVPPVASGE
jgi:hypothetical protein